jgi:hypothetical protein
MTLKQEVQRVTDQTVGLIESSLPDLSVTDRARLRAEFMREYGRMLGSAQACCRHCGSMRFTDEIDEDGDLVGVRCVDCADVQGDVATWAIPLTAMVIVPAPALGPVAMPELPF